MTITVEKVKTVNGITYVSDAGSTSPVMTAGTLESLPRPVVWICCSTQRGIDYSPLRYLAREKVTAIIFCGNESEELLDYFFHDVELFVKAETIEEAVLIASYCSYHNETVLFSPCASEYNNFFKGQDPHEAYVNAVNNLKV